VDAFVAVIVIGVVFVVVMVFALGRANQGSPMSQIGLRSAREITETKEALDVEDLEQMLAAHNRRRRARGQPEHSVADIELQVMNERSEQLRRRDALMADRELDQLLDATNARRRARGLPERTREEVRREFGGAAGDGQ